MCQNAQQAAKRLPIVVQLRASISPLPKPSRLKTLTLKCRRLNVLWTRPVSKVGLNGLDNLIFQLASKA